MTESFLAPVQQWLLFCGVLALVGCVAWRFAVAPGATQILGNGRLTGLIGVERRMATGGLIVTLMLALVWGLRMVVQVAGFRDPFVPLSEDLDFLIRDTFWGTVWVWQGALLPMLAAAFWLARPRGDFGGRGAGPASPLSYGDARGSLAAWGAAGILVTLLVLTLALSSHAMGVEPGRNLAVAADGLHALAGGAWVGALALILLLGRSPHGDSDLFSAQLRSFSPLAMASVVVLTGMGTFLSWTYIPTLADLWTTAYGRILSAKVATAGLVLLIGFINWRRGLPTLETPEGHSRMRFRAGWEITAALVVLLLTGILTQTPQP